MRKAVKWVALVLAVSLLLLQLVRPDRTNPEVIVHETLASSTAVPREVNTILERSCNDCHSNETVYPWYSNISPVSWFLAGHIRDAREELNFSIWSTYNERRKKRKLEEICETVRDGEMPLPSYLWIHRGAILSDEDRSLLCEWTAAEASRLQE